MEDTLRVLVHINVLIKNHLVLILIIMEDTLRAVEQFLERTNSKKS